ncbi:MAG: homocysteine S-methyltransferase family protein [Eggerthellaceae bacterium]
MRVKDRYLQQVLDGQAYLLFDGAMGTMMQAAGLLAGELPELLNMTASQKITQIHRAYVEAGSQVVTTNTFGANSLKLGDAASVDEVFAAAVKCARESGARYVAADVGPTGALLAPLGTMDFEEAYDLFAEQARAIQASGADLVIIETMADLLEAKAAVLAIRENCDLPVFATMTFGEDGRTFLGTTPEVAAITLSALGVQALGINCSLGPDALAGLARRMAPLSRVPLMVQANAGLPRVEDGVTVFDVSPDDYAQAARALLDAGVTVIGGCCGTDPEYISRLAELVDGRIPAPCAYEAAFALSSSQRALVLDAGSAQIAVVGERINPTGKPKLQEALRSGNMDYLLNEAIEQQENGADLLDVNVGLPEIDEPAVMAQAVDLIQGVCSLPLQVDSGDPQAIERATRRYSGKALVNSVSAKREVLDAILPVVKRNGCAVVGLTLDEQGIPPTADERFELARRIVQAAEEYGIPREDVVIDCLAMSASTNQSQVTEILRAISRVKRELGVRTMLGVSNISFGLPQRDLLNSTFLASAIGAGLDLPIINPKSERYRDVIAASRVLNGQDEGSVGFIAGYAQWEDPYKAPVLAAAAPVSQEAGAEDDGEDDDCDLPESVSRVPEDGAQVRHLVLTGRKAQMEGETRRLLESHEPLDLINGYFIPILDEVGELFESGEFFLPQLMASAEAVKVGFDIVKELAPAAEGEGKGRIIVATVKGDIHDIGKNIVKMLLENYGFDVIDLGRDVDPERVVQAVREHDVRLVGLSALMTTTVRGMEETIQVLREQAPECCVMVGGAVLNEEYAKMIGSDFYSRDAAGAATIAQRFFAGEIG